MENKENMGQRGANRRGRPPVTGEALARKQETVLRAVADLLGEVPANELSVEQVILAAGTSRPTFYRWFPGGLEQAVEMLVASANEDLMARILSVLGTTSDTPTRVNAGVQAYFDWAVAMGPLARAIYREGFDSTSPAWRYRQATLEAVYQIMTREASRLGLRDVMPLEVETLVGWLESAMVVLMRQHPISDDVVARQARFASAMFLRMIEFLEQQA
ncbi:TetR/AcrR family transcriptional regulator [Alcanivorax sp. 1008]|uniref:TetR/AcrR family transcriptional regulator n=1 Tax=Alcanivorax sp. 1008 TaxID=2816853 RepID=UPI001DAEAE1F|nr:TetR/AcrR family transcriptional regulator [Alcanivorax sp. 1008]MCC1495874.1 TetR/AcrR family transcriptional regulator [Alcanivorax sp. 1008]